ncbi:hypothetical protein Acr_02g0007160 [Actinidia rufa]|uniref:HCP-like superfamily protein n=1 Tax=Actinidia rufa TaxID=165716 RepID=A0A7J0E8I1_9ERIC|nr:hypothetical protein Acr_02g0007160 [Actinidia rufa]
MENNGGSSCGGDRQKLSRVVSDCVRRWFQDTLKEAKAGDLAMQVLVGQMYYNGYGVPKDTQKGRIWMTRASRVRSSVWKVSNKRPGDLSLSFFAYASVLVLPYSCMQPQPEMGRSRGPPRGGGMTVVPSVPFWLSLRRENSMVLAQSPLSSSSSTPMTWTFSVDSV